MIHSCLVCVWTICTDVKLLSGTSVHFCYGSWFSGFFFMQGAAGNVIVLQPTKTAMTFCDIDLGRWIDVPAINFPVNGNRLSQVPACRLVFHFFIMDNAVSGPSSELCFQQVSNHCTVFAIWFTADFVRWNSCFLQGQRKNSSLWVFPCHVIQLLPVRL